MKLKGVVVFFPAMWDCIVTSFALFLSSSDVNPGAPKRPSGARKGLEYALLKTELAAKTCHATGSGKQRLCLRNSLSSLTCFLILPDEFIDHQIVAITNNRQKGTRAAKDPIHPWSGAFQFSVNVLKPLLGVVQPGLETYH